MDGEEGSHRLVASLAAQYPELFVINNSSMAAESSWHVLELHSRPQWLLGTKVENVHGAAVTLTDIKTSVDYENVVDDVEGVVGPPFGQSRPAADFAPTDTFQLEFGVDRLHRLLLRLARA